MIAYLYAGVAVIIAALSGALWLQSERLDACQARALGFESAYNQLAGAVKVQSAAVADLERKGAAASKQAQAALEAARTTNEARAGEIAALRARIDAPTPAPTKADPVAGTCTHALRLVREDLK